MGEGIYNSETSEKGLKIYIGTPLGYQKCPLFRFASVLCRKGTYIFRVTLWRVALKCLALLMYNGKDTTNVTEKISKPHQHTNILVNLHWLLN